MSAPLVLKLVRHGESLANVSAFDPQKHGDYRTPLTDRGQEQARAAGAAIGHDFIQGALVYTSPYVRARQTLDGILSAADARAEALGVFEDPRLREVDHGYHDVKEQEPLRETHGWFYYRYKGGESPADCYDRVSGFLETLMRQVDRRSASRVLIVTHGLALRCFVMRFLHLTVEEFERMKNPDNGAVVTLAPRGVLPAYAYAEGGWEVDGLSFYAG